MLEGASERERFAAELRAKGEDEATVEAYLRIADRIAGVAGGWAIRPKHVDEAMRRAESEGHGAQQLANLKRVGDALVAFARPTLPPPIARASIATAAPGSLPLASSATPESSAAQTLGSCPACRGIVVVKRPGEGGGALGQAAGALGAVFGLVGVRLFGCFGVLTMMLAFAAVASLVTALLTKGQCTQCGRTAGQGELDPDTRGLLDESRRKAFFAALGLGAGALLTFFTWIAAAVALSGPP